MFTPKQQKQTLECLTHNLNNGIEIFDHFKLQLLDEYAKCLKNLKKCQTQLKRIPDGEEGQDHLDEVRKQLKQIQEKVPGFKNMSKELHEQTLEELFQMSMDFDCMDSLSSHMLSRIFNIRKETLEGRKRIAHNPSYWDEYFYE